MCARRAILQWGTTTEASRVWDITDTAVGAMRIATIAGSPDTRSTNNLLSRERLFCARARRALSEDQTR
jgi:hypothetical protein